MPEATGGCWHGIQPSPGAIRSSSAATMAHSMRWRCFWTAGWSAPGSTSGCWCGTRADLEAIRSSSAATTPRSPRRGCDAPEPAGSAATNRSPRRARRSSRTSGRPARAPARSPPAPSVASLFISCWGSAADPLLPPALHGDLGLAMAQKTYSSHLQLLSDKRWQAHAEAGAPPAASPVGIHLHQVSGPPGHLLPGPPGRPGHDRHGPGKTLLAFADHGSLDHRLDPDYAAAERTISAIADAGVDVDLLAERLQRQGAGRFGAIGPRSLPRSRRRQESQKPKAVPEPRPP